MWGRDAQMMAAAWDAWSMDASWGGGKDWGGKAGGKGEGVPAWAQTTNPFAVKGGKWGAKAGCKGGGMPPWAAEMMAFWGGGKGKGMDMGKGGKAQAKLALGESVYHGVVKSFNVDKKHGYIVCEGVFNECAQDVYAFQDVLQEGFAGPGDTVAFFVHWSPKGQPQASAPLLRLACPEAWALKGKYKAAKDPASNYGFIDCPEAKEFFGRDVYVNQTNLPPMCKPGDTVMFNAYLNRDGQPNALAMEICEPEWEPQASDLSTTVHLQVGKGGWKGAEASMASKGPGKGKKGGWGGMDAGMQMGMMLAAKGGGKTKGANWGGGGGGGPAGKPTSTGEAFVGTMKSFNQASNYGFIECPEVKEVYGFDVFVHGKEVQEGQNIGDQVYFELGISSKGQPQALNLSPLDASGNPVAGVKRRRLTPGMQPQGAAQGS